VKGLQDISANLEQQQEPPVTTFMDEETSLTKVKDPEDRYKHTLSGIMKRTVVNFNYSTIKDKSYRQISNHLPTENCFGVSPQHLICVIAEMDSSAYLATKPSSSP
jgi:hypothetical protein